MNFNFTRIMKAAVAVASVVAGSASVAQTGPIAAPTPVSVSR